MLIRTCRFFIANLLLILAAEKAYAEASTVIVGLTEYRVGSVKPEVYEAIADGADVSVTLVGTELKISVPDGAKRLSVKLGAGQGFRERTVALYATALRVNHKRSFVIERTRSLFNHDYLNEGRVRLDGERDPDAALALFDNAFRDSTRVDTELNAYEATLRYNYARALQQTCLRLEFDTCEDARQMLGEILDSINSSLQDKRVYGSVRVTASLVQRALTDLIARDAKVQYGRFTAAIAAGDYEQAKASIGAVEEGIANNPKAMRSQGLTASRIAKDRAFLRTLRSDM